MSAATGGAPLRIGVLDGWILGPVGHRACPKVPNAINPHPIHVRGRGNTESMTRAAIRAIEA